MLQTKPASTDNKQPCSKESESSSAPGEGRQQRNSGGVARSGNLGTQQLRRRRCGSVQPRPVE
eukprot:2904514-Alexandrium_andersonii.AAC.1